MLVCAFLCASMHTRPRVQRAPGLPCALFLWGADDLQTSGGVCRENAESYLVVPAHAGTHTPCPLFFAVGSMPSFPTNARGDGSLRSQGRRDVSPHSRDSMRPRFAKSFAPKSKRAQGRPGARCTRGLVCIDAQGNAHTSIQVQRKHSGLPCAMALRLISCSPW